MDHKNVIKPNLKFTSSSKAKHIIEDHKNHVAITKFQFYSLVVTSLKSLFIRSKNIFIYFSITFSKLN